MHLFDECPLHFDAADVNAPSRFAARDDLVRGPGHSAARLADRPRTIPSDYAAQLSIAADGQARRARWRVSTSQGVTPSLRFVVGDLPEVVEEEIDGEPIPVAVTLPVTINGRMFPRRGRRRLVVPAKKGQTIRCEVEADAARLAARLAVGIVDAAGRRLAENSDHLRGRLADRVHRPGRRRVSGPHLRRGLRRACRRTSIG